MTHHPPHESLVDPTKACILALNGGSSTIKFAVFRPAASPDAPPSRWWSGQVERAGTGDTTLTAFGPAGGPPVRQTLEGADHHGAALRLIEWLRVRLGTTALAGVGHRVVHGGPRLLEHQAVTPELLAELRRTQPLDPAHLPREIALIEAFGGGFPDVPQVACLDTVFHRDLPRVAQLLPIPRRYTDAGVRRFGFHGLSYAFLMEELRRIAGNAAADGRVILAHLGSGASMAAVRGGRPLDTTMSFTPSAGLVMGTRPGDLDPGLLLYLMSSENRTAQEMDEFINTRYGLLGVSETSSDMRELLKRRTGDPRAAEAVALFCYQAKKFIGAYAAAMGGLDTLVFSGGIGEHAPEIRDGVCAGLEFLGVRLDPSRNDANQAVISADGSDVVVRVMQTDEEMMIARTTLALIKTAQ